MTVLSEKMVRHICHEQALSERGYISFLHTLCVLLIAILILDSVGVIMNDETVHQLCKQAVSQVIVGISSHINSNCQIYYRIWNAMS